MRGIVGYDAQRGKKGRISEKALRERSSWEEKPDGAYLSEWEESDSVEAPHILGESDEDSSCRTQRSETGDADERAACASSEPASMRHRREDDVGRDARAEKWGERFCDCPFVAKAARGDETDVEPLRHSDQIRLRPLLDLRQTHRECIRGDCPRPDEPRFLRHDRTITYRRGDRTITYASLPRI